jgi:hypothetical protein
VALDAVSVDSHAPGKRQKRGGAFLETGKNLAKSLISMILPHLRRPGRPVHSGKRKN